MGNLPIRFDNTKHYQKQGKNKYFIYWKLIVTKLWQGQIKTNKSTSKVLTYINSFCGLYHLYLMPIVFMFHAFICQFWNMCLATLNSTLKIPPTSPQIHLSNHPLKNPKWTPLQWQIVASYDNEKTKTITKTTRSLKSQKQWWETTSYNNEKPMTMNKTTRSLK